MQQNSRLCPHFHVSLQSANGRVLSAMKRGYGATQIEERFHSIQEKIPHAYIGLDLIAGFPGETEEEFEEGFARLEKISFTKAHVFPFSVRRNTAAARLVEAGIAVPPQVIHQRAARLRALSEQKFRAGLESKIGSMAEVLVEEKRLTVNGRQCSTGHARNFHKVLIPGSHEPNKLYRARIVGVHQDLLKGELV
jgi:threonylcarbamoyladenosine tRNA methylthiotransferase MtaB